MDKLNLIREEVDLLFQPNDDFIYKKNYKISLGNTSKKLCGKDRKGHFEGVSKVILNFLELIKPDSIFLGEKDFQQMLVIKKIISDFGFSTKIKILPTIRDENKIALSSRNQLVKNKALTFEIPKTLQKIIKEIFSGNFKFSNIDDYKKDLLNLGFERVNYLEILKESNLDSPDEKLSFCRVFISVNIDGVRLIDNMPIGKRIQLVAGSIVINS